MITDLSIKFYDFVNVYNFFRYVILISLINENIFLLIK